MDRYQLKNVIILILLLVNGFLLGSMAYRGTAARAARDRSVEQLVELFSSYCMETFPGAIPDETHRRTPVPKSRIKMMTLFS